VGGVDSRKDASGEKRGKQGVQALHEVGRGRRPPGNTGGKRKKENCERGRNISRHVEILQGVIFE